MEQRKIEEALEDVYRAVGITYHTTAQEILDHFENQDYPIMIDAYNRLYEMLEAEQNRSDPDYSDITLIKNCIAYIKPLAVGAESFMFNGHTNVDLSNPLINFDVSGLQDNTANSVLKTQYYNILSYIWSDIVSSKDDIRKQVYADEVSVIMDPRFENTSMMIMAIEKRARKRNAGITIATQQLSDLLKDSVKESGESIIENSTYHFFFSLGAKSISLLKETELVPSSEIEFISRASMGQCFAKFGKSTAMRIQIDIDPVVLEEFERFKN